MQIRLILGLLLYSCSQVLFAEIPKLSRPDPQDYGTGQASQDCAPVPSTVLDPEKVDLAHWEALFVREMTRLNYDDVVRAVRSRNRQLPESRWSVHATITSPKHDDRIKILPHPNFSVEMKADDLSDHPESSIRLIGCLHWKSLKTPAVWNQLFYGGFSTSPSQPHNNSNRSSFSISTQRLPCGPYELHALICGQERPSGPLTFATRASIRFTAEPWLNNSEFHKSFITLMQDQRVAPLAKAERLKFLLGGTELTDDVWRAVCTWKELRHLDLSELVVPDSVFELLIHSEHLEALSLSHAVFTAAELSQLKSVGTLRELDLTGASVPPGNLEHLEPLQSLETLKLGRLHLNARDLRACATLAKLSRLDLNHVELTQDLGPALRGLQPAIQELNLQGSNLSNADLRELLGKLPELRKLDISRTSIQPGALQDLQAHSRLESLDLVQTRLVPADLEVLKTVNMLRQLKLDQSLSGAPVIQSLIQRGVTCGFAKPNKAHLDSLWPTPAD